MRRKADHLGGISEAVLHEHANRAFSIYGARFRTIAKIMHDGMSEDHLAEVLDVRRPHAALMDDVIRAMLWFCNGRRPLLPTRRRQHPSRRQRLCLRAGMERALPSLRGFG
jgi:hypothetical protein